MFRPTRCPNCGFDADAVTNATGTRPTPKRGDVGLCSECRLPSIFTEANDYWFRRKLTDREWVDLLSRPAARAALESFARTAKPCEYTDELRRRLHRER